MLSPFEWWCRNFILPDICKPCLFVFLRNLFYLTNKDGKSWYAIATMAKDLSISRSTIKRALAELIHQGRVEKQARFRENRGCTSNCYQIKQLMRI